MHAFKCYGLMVGKQNYNQSKTVQYIYRKYYNNIKTYFV